MKIIVGLGNPGLRYRNTRHNVGFMALTVLAKRHGLKIKKKGFHGEYCIGRIAGQEIALLKPMTYMNLSGEAVAAICSSRLEDERDLLVVNDDIDLPFGTIRVREKGSSGGHNGLRSIIDMMGSGFARLKIGVRGENAPADAASFVLSRFNREEKSKISGIIEQAADCIETWIKEGTRPAMNRYN